LPFAAAFVAQLKARENSLAAWRCTDTAICIEAEYSELWLVSSGVTISSSLSVLLPPITAMKSDGLCGYSKIRVAVREAEASKCRFSQKNSTSYDL
jgi:hypothetical protein